MKTSKISFFLFCIIVPFLIVYFLVSKIIDLRNGYKCCEGDEGGEEKKTVTPRQGKIVAYIEENESATVPQLMKLFDKVTDRTLRRDLNKMEEQGIVLRSGSTKSVSYTLKK